MLLHTCSRQRYFTKFEYLYFVIGVVTVMFLLIFAIVILSRLGYQGSNAKTIRLSASLALLPIRSNATSAVHTRCSHWHAHSAPQQHAVRSARWAVHIQPIHARWAAKWSGRSVADSATAAPEKLQYRAAISPKSPFSLRPHSPLRLSIRGPIASKAWHLQLSDSDLRLFLLNSCPPNSRRVS